MYINCVDLLLFWGKVTIEACIVVPLCIIEYDKVSIDFTVDICRENIQDAAKAKLGPSSDSCTIGKLYQKCLHMCV